MSAPALVPNEQAERLLDPRVPYAALREAEQLTRELFESAANVVARWTPGSEDEIHVEVWWPVESGRKPRFRADVIALHQVRATLRRVNERVVA